MFGRRSVDGSAGRPCRRCSSCSVGPPAPHCPGQGVRCPEIESVGRHARPLPTAAVRHHTLTEVRMLLRWAEGNVEKAIVALVATRNRPGSSAVSLVRSRGSSSCVWPLTPGPGGGTGRAQVRRSRRPSPHHRAWSVSWRTRIHQVQPGPPTDARIDHRISHPNSLFGVGRAWTGSGVRLAVCTYRHEDDLYGGRFLVAFVASAYLLVYRTRLCTVSDMALPLIWSVRARCSRRRLVSATETLQRRSGTIRMPPPSMTRTLPMDSDALLNEG